MRKVLPLVLMLLAGCAIADRSDKLSAEFELGIGGLLSYIAEIHVKGSIGFSKTCPELEGGEHGKVESLGGRGAGRDRGFL